MARQPGATFLLRCSRDGLLALDPSSFSPKRLAGIVVAVRVPNMKGARLRVRLVIISRDPEPARHLRRSFRSAGAHVLLSSYLDHAVEDAAEAEVTLLLADGYPLESVLEVIARLRVRLILIVTAPHQRLRNLLGRACRARSGPRDSESGMVADPRRGDPAWASRELGGSVTFRPLDVRLTLVSKDPETLDGVQQYFERMGAAVASAVRLEKAASSVRVADGVLVFPDDYPFNQALSFVLTLDVKVIVVVTADVERFQSSLRDAACSKNVFVLQRPAWGWMLLDAVRTARADP